MKRFSALLLMSLLISLGSAQAATITVNAAGGGDFTTIQAAINAAVSGDVILVAAGTYNEGLSIGKSVSILGPNDSLSPNTAVRVAPAVLAPLGNTHAIVGTAANVSVTVKGMNFDLTGTNNNYRFVQLENKANTTWTFEHNVFANARECVNGNWYLTGTLGDLYFNLLDNLLTGSLSSNGISLWGQGVNHVDIRENVFRDNESWTMNLKKVHGTISSNLFTDTAVTGPEWYSDQSAMIVAAAGNDLALTDNTFNSMNYGVTIYDGFDGVLTATGNTFVGSVVTAVRVRPGVPSDLSEVTFNGNTFNSNVMGVENTSAAILNALNNYWGDDSGPANAVLNPPGTGDAVSNNTLFTPWVGRTTVVLAQTATPSGSFFLEGTPAIGIDGDGAAGFGSGSIKAPNAYSRYEIDPVASFGRTVTVGELHRISYLTKKGTLHTVDASDWFPYIYTEPYVGGHSSWYGNRIGSEPYFSQNLVETAGAWNQWTTDAGANNRLRFFDSSPPTNYFGSYTDGFLSDLTSNSLYTSQLIHKMGISVGSAWAAGFNGQLDGLVIELKSGETLQVNFESGNAAVAMTPATSGPINCSQSQTLTVNLTKTEGMADVFGFNAVVRADGPITWGPITNLAAFGASTLFFSFDQGDGSYAISGTTVGNPAHPIIGAGTTALFSIQYSPSGTGTGDITFDSFTLRDPSNATIPSVATGATFSIDCDAPAAVTGISATTGHNKINVAWSHSGSDVNHYEVYAGLWHDGSHASAYPEYDDMAADVIPSRPASRAAAAASADWALVASPATTSSLQSWADNLHRGVYYYEVFAVDAAGNASAAASAGDRATNYWLGDVSVPFDGMVAVGDISRLGATFGLAGGAGGYDNESDVGPTDDNSGIGIPSTDSRINFEDLMIFALNFGVAGPSKALDYDHTAPVLAWAKVGDGAWALQLSTPCAALKGLHLTGVADGQIVAVPGALLADQSTPVMFELGTGLDINLAVMGSNLGMSGSGELLRIEGISDISSIVVDARGLDNAALKAEIRVGNPLPGVFAVRPNYPNPFNPQTTISFDMSRTGPVQVGIFDLGGRCVRTLLNESRAAGSHTVIWNGMDDAGNPAASGTYLYRVRTDGQEITRKMLLMK